MAIKISRSRCETYDFFSKHAHCPIVRPELYSKAQLASSVTYTESPAISPPPSPRNFAHLQLSCCAPSRATLLRRENLVSPRFRFLSDENGFTFSHNKSRRRRGRDPINIPFPSLVISFPAIPRWTNVRIASLLFCKVLFCETWGNKLMTARYRIARCSSQKRFKVEFS